MENARSPAAAPITSFIAAAILLPASREISWAFAAISAIVSRTSWPRWPGLRFGGVVGEVSGAFGVSVIIKKVGRRVAARWRSARKYMIFQCIRKWLSNR